MSKCRKRIENKHVTSGNLTTLKTKRATEMCTRVCLCKGVYIVYQFDEQTIYQIMRMGIIHVCLFVYAEQKYNIDKRNTSNTIFNFY